MGESLIERYLVPCVGTSYPTKDIVLRANGIGDITLTLAPILSSYYDIYQGPGVTSIQTEVAGSTHCNIFPRAATSLDDDICIVRERGYFALSGVCKNLSVGLTLLETRFGTILVPPLQHISWGR